MASLCDNCGHALPNTAGSGLYCNECGEPVGSPRERVAAIRRVKDANPSEPAVAVQRAFRPSRPPRPTLQVGTRVSREDEETGRVKRGTVLGQLSFGVKVRVDVDPVEWRSSAIGPPSSVTAVWERWTCQRINDNEEE